MVLSYLIGGKCLKGVEYTDPTDTLNQSSFSFSSSASSSLSDFSLNANQIFTFENTQHQQQQSKGGAIFLRRHGLTSQDFSERLLQVNKPELWIELDASRNQITTLPSQIQLFTGLSQLILTNNAISVIPSELYHHLGQLQTLMLSENQIESIPQDLPQYLPMLVTLTLDSNQLTSLPDSIGYWVNMKELKLGSEFGGNLLTTLPNTIADMTNLVDLDVSFNVIDSLIPDTFLNLPHLRSVNLSHNAITELPNDILFGACNKLITLDLSDNQINTLPHMLVTDIMRLQSLELLNISNNQLCIIPSELLDQPTKQIIIKGNPVTHFSFQQQQHEEQDQESSSDAYSQIIRSMIVRAELNDDFSINHSIHMNRNDDLNVSNQPQDIDSILTEQARVYRIGRDHSAVSLSSRAELTGVAIETPSVIQTPAEEATEDKEYNNTFLLHSLREISLRTIVSLSENDASIISLIPDHIAYDLNINKIQNCGFCHKPYIREWLSSVQLKSYRGHPSVVRKIRFCGTKCWQEHNDRRNQKALEAQSNILNPSQQQQDAIQYIQQHEHTLEPGSIDWIMAAVSAATAQEQQADSLANAVF